MSIIYFTDKNTYGKIKKSHGIATGIVYNFQDNKAVNWEPSIDNKKVINGTKAQIEEKLKKGEITKEAYETHLLMKEKIQQIRDKFEAKDLDNPSPEQIMARQIQYATQTSIKTQNKEIQTDALNFEEIDPFTGMVKTSVQTGNQNVNIGYALDLETFRMISKQIQEEQFLPFDLVDGRIELVVSNNGRSVDERIFANNFVNKKTGEKIFLKPSENSDFNRDQGILKKFEDANKAKQEREQNIQAKPQQSEPKKEEKQK